jgi:hypothetical protein
MTRDEAVKIASKGDPDNPTLNFHAEGFVSLLEKLGVLKLDEPKSADNRIAQAVGAAFGFSTSPHEMPLLHRQLKILGLKIVEI